MIYGTLYGVGVGPGAPDLLTLRAVETLKRAEVLALPRSSDYGSSMAWKIIEPAIGTVPGQERLFLTFPMSKSHRVCAALGTSRFRKLGNISNAVARLLSRRKATLRFTARLGICSGKHRSAGPEFAWK